MHVKCLKHHLLCFKDHNKYWLILLSFSIIYSSKTTWISINKDNKFELHYEPLKIMRGTSVAYIFQDAFSEKKYKLQSDV